MTLKTSNNASRPRRIWIDGFEANVPQRVGSGQVAFGLLKTIEKIDLQNEYTILLPSPPLDDLPKERKGFRYKLYKPSRFKTRLGIPLAIHLAKEKPDVFFSPTHYIPQFTNVPRVVMIFDLAFFHYQKMFTTRDFLQLKNWTGYSIKNAERVITISKASKKDIINFYQTDPDKISVAYPGYDPTSFKRVTDKKKIEEVKNKYGITNSYILYTGTIQPRKNLVNLIEAFRNIEGLKLVLAGKYSGVGRQAWMTEEILSAPTKFGIEDKVIFTNYTPREDLPPLMTGAVAIAQVALYEGFGMPVVEAMACGTPAIVSNVSSLPEAAGEAGLLVDPNSVTQIEQAIRLISSDKKLREKLAKKALTQAQKFTWENMAREVIRVLEEV
jgi:glycosyltransferase involved in cell wall biosynthesis